MFELSSSSQTLVGMSLVVWLPWYEWKVPVTSPGIIALAGAICLIIIVRKEEKIIQAIDLQTLLFVAAYRYTTQVCPSCYVCIKTKSISVYTKGDLLF